MTLWTLHCHILFGNLFLGFQDGRGSGPFRKPAQIAGGGEACRSVKGSALSVSTKLGYRNLDEAPPPLQLFPPPSSRYPPLWALPSPVLLPGSSLYSHPVFLFLPFSPLPSAPSSAALGIPSPWGEVGGRTFWWFPLISLLASGGPLSPLLPKTHLKFVMECIPILSENLRRGLILGYIKGQPSTFNPLWALHLGGQFLDGISWQW